MIADAARKSACATQECVRRALKQPSVVLRQINPLLKLILSPSAVETRRLPPALLDADRRDRRIQFVERRSHFMAIKPFKEKELQKDKEIAALEKLSGKDVQKDKHEKEKHEKEKREKNEPKEKQEKEKHEKEKNEKEQKEQKETKEQKEQKEQKDQKDKEQKNEQKEKHEKEKHEKELKDRKEIAKEHKEGGKELEIFPATASPAEEAAAELANADVAAASAGTAAKIVEKLPKVEKLEKHEKDKFEKIEKHEKFEKHEKHEKFEHKELEKTHFDGKDLVEGGIFQAVGDPVMSQRVAALEATVAQLMHFIPENLRPDLTQGALRQEPDAPAQGQTVEPAKAETPKAETKTPPEEPKKK